MKHLIKITAQMLALLLTIGVFPIGQAAAETASAPAQALPASYDGRDYGYVTSIRDQGQFETCWTFGTLASIEAYMVKHGICNASTGAPADLDLDLAESHLAWFSYTQAYDALGLLAGDATVPSENYLSQSSTNAMISYTLMRGAGPAAESEKALKYRNKRKGGLSEKYAFDYNAASVTDVTWIPATDRDAVKRAIMDYGAGSIAYHHDFSCMDLYAPDCTGGYYCGDYSDPNHLVCIIGWDDNFPKENFEADYRPEHDGAWLIKNSWGPDLALDGYFYLSYEESSANAGSVVFYKVEALRPDRSCYQYDGTSNCISFQAMADQGQLANVFTALETGGIQSVALATKDQNTSYTLCIYKNPSDEADPASGTLLHTQDGLLPYAGYHNIPLNSMPLLREGDRFAVVFTLSTPEPGEDGAYLHIPYDASAKNIKEPDMEHPVSWIHADHGSTSFYREAGGEWTDCPDKGDFRIKAYVSDPYKAVSVQLNQIWSLSTAVCSRLLHCLLGR